MHIIRPFFIAWFRDVWNQLPRSVSICSILVAFLLAGSAPGATTAVDSDRCGEIVANRLNVRAKPGVSYEVVCQLAKGTVVYIAAEAEDWFGIYAPKNAEAWIAASQLNGNVTATGNVPVYSGPGAIFTAYASLPAGAVIERQSIADDKWVKIEPPRDAIVWVHKDYVRLEEPGEPTLPVAPADPGVASPSSAHETLSLSSETVAVASSAEGTTPSATNEKMVVAPIPFPPLYRNVEFIGKITEVERNGVVMPVSESHRPFRHILAVAVNNTYFPLAYITNEGDDLDQWSGKSVRVSGTQQWIRGWARPMIKVQTIEAAEGKF